MSLYYLLLNIKIISHTIINKITKNNNSLKSI